MKKFILSILSGFLYIMIFAQEATRVPSQNKQDYLKKSKNQKTTGVVLLTSGSVLATIGLVMTLSNLSGLFDPNDPPEYNSNTADILGYSGLVIATTSIPFFVASSKNKKKAFSLSLKNEPVPQTREKRFFYRSVPSISVSMNL